MLKPQITIINQKFKKNSHGRLEAYSERLSSIQRGTWTPPLLEQRANGLLVPRCQQAAREPLQVRCVLRRSQALESIWRSMRLHWPILKKGKM